jgi:hypothetical protein
MSTTDIAFVIISTVSAGGYNLRYWLRLRFLRHTFDRSGDRNDLEMAGKVTAPGWLVWDDREPTRGSKPSVKSPLKGRNKRSVTSGQACDDVSGPAPSEWGARSADRAPRNPGDGHERR